MSAPTFGSVKNELALVVSGGVTGNDPRVLTLTNAAMRALAQDVPRGVFVGACMTAAVNVTTGNMIALPPGMDVVHVVEGIEGQSQVNSNGWYNLISNSTFVDPDDTMDTVLIDAGFNSAGIRSYKIPELPSGTTQVQVWGLKSFSPVTQDSDTLFLPNVRAVKRMILALEKTERYDREDDGETLRKEAVQILVSELERALLDPQRYSARQAAWNLEAQSFAPGTLGSTRALIAVDMQRGQRVGRNRINRLVDRALRWINQAIYEYALIERNRVKDSVPTLATIPASPSDAITPPVQHEIIRQVVQAIMAEDHQGLDDDRGQTGTGKLTPGAELTVSQKLLQEALGRLQRMLDAQLEALRHTTYAAVIDSYAGGDEMALGYVAAKFGLELKDGLKFSNVELYRLVTESTREAISRYNALGKRERYSNADGPNQITGAISVSQDDPLPYSNYEVLSGLARAQLIELVGGNAAPVRDAALAAIERDLAADVDAARSTSRYAKLDVATNTATLGYLIGRIGLEVPDQATALTYNDNQFRRWINEASREAVAHSNFLSRTEQYSNVAGPGLLTYAPAVADSDVVSYSDFEVLRRLVAAQIVEGADAARGLRAEVLAPGGLIERNLQQSIEAARNTTWQGLITSNPDPQFGGMRAKIGLEFQGETGHEGYRWSDRQAGRLLRQVWAALVDEINFQARQEDYEQALYTAPADAPANSDVVPFPFELIKLGVEALTAQDSNKEQRALAYRTAVQTLIRRNLSNTIERARRTAWETALTATPVPQFGGVVASIGLDFTGNFEFSAAKLTRWVTQAWDAANAHYNFLSRQENYAQTPLALPTPILAASVIPYPIEVIKLLTEGLIYQDTKDADRAGMLKKSAFDLIERNLKQQVEQPRRLVWLSLLTTAPFPQFGGARAQFALELAGTLGGEGYMLSDAYAGRLTQQGWKQAADHYNFLASGEDYEQTLLTAPTAQPADTDTIPFSFEIVKMLAEAQFVRDRGDAARADAIRESAYKLVERNLRADTERTRRTAWEAALTATPVPKLGGYVAQIGLEFAGNYTFSAAKIRRWTIQAWVHAMSEFNSLSRQEDYEQAEQTLPSPVLDSSTVPYPLEIIKLLTEALICQDAKDLDRAAGLKKSALDLIARNLVALIERGRRTAWEGALSATPPPQFGGTYATIALEFLGAYTFADNKLQRWVSQAWAMAVDHQNFLARRESYTAAVLTAPAPMPASDAVIPFPVEVIKLLAESLVCQDTKDADRAGMLKKSAFDLIERNLKEVIETARKTAWLALIVSNPFPQFGGARAQFALELAGDSDGDAYALSDAYAGRLTQQGWKQAADEYNSISRGEDYAEDALTTPPTNPANTAVITPFSLDVIKTLAEAQYAQDRNKPDRAADLRGRALGVIGRDLRAGIERDRRVLALTQSTTLDAATLGYVGAKLALELPGGLQMSEAKRERLVNEAVRQAINQRNSFGRLERYSNLDGPNTLVYAPTLDPGDTLPYSDYGVISLLVRAQIEDDREGGDGTKLRDEAFAIIGRDLATEVDAARNTARYDRLAASPASSSLSYMVARFGLEAPDPATALMFSDNQLRRFINESAREALQERNNLARTERYSNLAGPQPVDFLYASTDDELVSYPDLEVLRRLVSAMMVDNPESGRAFRAEANTLIERNLQKAIESARNSQWHCLLLSNPFPQFGGARAQVGLEYGGDGGADGYKLSDGFVSRITQQAWCQAVDQLNFLSRTEDYEQDLVTLPAPVPADDAEIPFPIEVIKLYAEAQACQDRNEEQRATSYKQQASELIQRNLAALVERNRRVAWEQALSDTPYPELGGAVAQIGLEYAGTYKFSAAKLQRWVSQAWAMAVDHQNFLARRESYTAAVLTAPTSPDAGDTIPFPIEVIKLLSESLMCQDASDTQRADALKKNGLDLIERNLKEVIETARKTAWLALIVSNPFPQFGGARAAFALELAGDSDGDAYALSDAYAGRLTWQGWRQAADHYNFLSRREDYEEAAYTAPAFLPAAGDSIPFSLEIVKLLAQAQYAQDRNKPEQASTYKTQAHSLIERDLQNTVERARRTAWETALTATPVPQFGGIASQIGLEHMDGFGYSAAKITRWTRQAWQQAADQSNFFARREAYKIAQVTLPSPVVDSSVVGFPIEIIKLLTEALIAQDAKQPDAAGLKKSAFDLIERNVKQAVETARRDVWLALIVSNPFPQFGGARAQFALELAGNSDGDAYALSDAYAGRLTWQGWRQAADHYNALTSGEDYEDDALTAPTSSPADDEEIPFSIEIVKLFAEALYAQDRKETDRASSAKQQAQALVERDLRADTERDRRVAWEADLQNNPFPQLAGAVAQIGLEYLGNIQFSAAKIRRWVNQAAQIGVDQFNYLTRTEDYEAAALTLTVPLSSSTVLPFPLEVVKLLTESLISQDAKSPDAAASAKAAAFELIERNIKAMTERQRRTAWESDLAAHPFPALAGAVAQVGLEYMDALTYSAAKIARWVTQAAQMGIDQYSFLSRTEDYDAATLTIANPALPTSTMPFSLEVLKLLTESLIAQDRKDQNAAATAKQEAFTLVERNLKQSVERARRVDWQNALGTNPLPQLGGFVARIGLEHSPGLGFAASKVRRWTIQAWAQAIDHFNSVVRRESYKLAALTLPTSISDNTSVTTFSLEIIKLLTESLIAQDTPQAGDAAGLKKSAFELIERNVKQAVETARRDVWLALIVSNPFPQFGGARAQFALELAGNSDGDAYALSDAYAGRLTQQGWRQAADHYNFLSRTEDYEAAAQTAPPSAPADTDVIPIAFEIVKMLAEAQYLMDRNQPDAAKAMKDQALDLIARNLTATIERARREAAEMQIELGHLMSGYYVGRLGLELPGGLGMSDSKRRRLVNEAEELLANSGRWKFMEGEYFLAVGDRGEVVVPADVESVIFAEWCGQRIELRDRRWLYSGWATRLGEGVWEGWNLGRSPLPLTYAGPDADGNANYVLAQTCMGTWFHTSTVRPSLRALCRRKWIYKENDADTMLVHNYPAVKHSVQSLLCKEAKDWQGASIQSNSALKALDNQLGAETEGQTPYIEVDFAGLPRGGTMRRWGR